MFTLEEMGGIITLLKYQKGRHLEEGNNEFKLRVERYQLAIRIFFLL